MRARWPHADRAARDASAHHCHIRKRTFNSECDKPARMPHARVAGGYQRADVHAPPQPAAGRRAYRPLGQGRAVCPV